ncbi:MAG: hypothetical protein ACRCYZ_06625 [Alphaproteobacteria bacterium]
MRKAQKVKDTQRGLKKAYKQLLIDPAMQLQVAVTNRVLGLLKDGTEEHEIVNTIAKEQGSVIDKMRVDFAHLEMTDKFYKDLAFSTKEIEDIVMHGKALQAEMEAKYGEI